MPNTAKYVLESTNIIPFHEKNMTCFNYEGLRIKESCWIAGKPHFTARAIGEWLEYRFPQQAITKIVERNSHIKQFATVVILTTVEGGREVTREIEVYDPIGLQLIINKSNQPKAVLFQVAVAHLVVDYINGDIRPSKWSQRGEFLSAARQALSLPEGRKRRQIIINLAARENISLQQTYRRIESATGERLKTTKGRPRSTRTDAGTHRNQAEYEQVMQYKRVNPQAGPLTIKTALGLKTHVSTIKNWLKGRQYSSQGE